MKKFLALLLIVSLASIMFSCIETDIETTSIVQSTTNQPTTTTTVEPTTTTNTTTMLTTLETINFKFDDFSGQGTIKDPYVIDMTVEDPFSKVINFHIPSNPLVYEEGIILEDNFLPVNEEQKALSLEGSNNFTLSIQAFSIGVFYVRISSEGAYPTYLKINVEEYTVDFERNLKVLAIGNSFSVDAMEYLYKIASDYGIQNIVLGIMYIPGASLSRHVECINNDLSDYVYYKNTNDSWYYQDSSATLLDGLLDENWDVITIQQVSGYSGIPSSYNGDIDTIINYVNEHKTNDQAQIHWHMTWAYQSDSTHPDFVRYSSNQMTMYNAITSTVQDRILTRTDILNVIPSGTAIQNLRTSYYGDTLTRDGYHLSLDVGRYTAGLTWFMSITGLSIDQIQYKPIGVTETDLLAIKEAVQNACLYPYQITDSSYPTE